MTPSIPFLGIYPRDVKTYVYIPEQKNPTYGDKRQITGCLRSG